MFFAETSMREPSGTNGVARDYFVIHHWTSCWHRLQHTNSTYHNSYHYLEIRPDLGISYHNRASTSFGMGIRPVEENPSF